MTVADPAKTGDKGSNDEECCLVVRDPVAGRSVLRLPPGQRVSLGRAPSNHVVIHDERASRFHAEIFDTSEGWAVRDLSSRNGTLLAGEPLRADHRLAAGDVFSIGRVEVSFYHGDPPRDSTSDGLDGTATGSDVAAWQASIIHRRTRGRLLDDLKQTAEIAPRVGRAAAELCRLAFSLGRAAGLDEVAKLAIEAAVDGVEAARGFVLLPPSLEAGRRVDTDTLRLAASMPDPWTEPVPTAVAATVLGTDEAILAGGQETGSGGSTISAPIRWGGRAVGVLHLEIEGTCRVATPDDLEYAMAVCDAVTVALENLAARDELTTRLATAADENAWLKRRLGEESRMVGESPALRKILGQVERVAGTRATVLIRGESGVGKELVARAIHDASDRVGRPFVCLNCAALSETLLESELFGHEKGAFTGATDRKAGKFEAADTGTLVLDEIGEMSPAIQAKFLRVLEGHPFERVGGSKRLKVDVRVVAATNRDLEEAVKAGDFRRDLYFRLKVVEILVPPLRHRREDIEPLAMHFLARFAEETGRRVRGFTPEAIDALLEYHWPGNIREMRNIVERAVVLSQADLIDMPELALCQLSTPGDTGQGPAAAPFKPESLEEVERRHVKATLEATGGNKTKAAGILGIERSTLDRKLARWAKKYGS